MLKELFARRTYAVLMGSFPSYPRLVYLTHEMSSATSFIKLDFKEFDQAPIKEPII